MWWPVSPKTAQAWNVKVSVASGFVCKDTCESVSIIKGIAVRLPGRVPAAAGQVVLQNGLESCQLNTSLPVGTRLTISFWVLQPGRPELNATVTRTLLLVCPQGKQMLIARDQDCGPGHL